MFAEQTGPRGWKGPGTQGLCCSWPTASALVMSTDCVPKPRTPADAESHAAAGAYPTLDFIFALSGLPTRKALLSPPHLDNLFIHKLRTVGL